MNDSVGVKLMTSSNSGGEIWRSGCALLIGKTHSYTTSKHRLRIDYPLTTLTEYVGSTNLLGPYLVQRGI